MGVLLLFFHYLSVGRCGIFRLWGHPSCGWRPFGDAPGFWHRSYPSARETSKTAAMCGSLERWGTTISWRVRSTGQNVRYKTDVRARSVRGDDLACHLASQYHGRSCICVDQTSSQPIQVSRVRWHRFHPLRGPLRGARIGISAIGHFEAIALAGHLG